MDTSKEYIKMCEKAEEIQHNKLKIGDFGVIPNAVYEYFKVPSVIIRIEEDVEFDRVWLNVPDENYVSADSIIFLPRQDQLQEMWEYSHSALRSLQKFACELHNNYNYYDKFISMEQLWLVFVMKEKYNKIWNGEEWK